MNTAMQSMSRINPGFGMMQGNENKPPSTSSHPGYEALQFPTRGGRAADIYSSMGGDLYNRLLSMSHGSPEMFQNLEAPAMAQFHQQIAPQIAQRYAGSGIGASSGMQNSLAGAGANLALGLQGQRNALMQQSMQDVLNLGNLLLSRPDVENVYQKEAAPWWHQALGIGLPIAGGLVGGAFGGVPGAIAGSKVGSMAGQSFLS